MFAVSAIMGFAIFLGEENIITGVTHGVRSGALFTPSLAAEN